MRIKCLFLLIVIVALVSVIRQNVMAPFKLGLNIMTLSTTILRRAECQVLLKFSTVLPSFSLPLCIKLVHKESNDKEAFSPLGDRFEPQIS